MGIYQNPRFQRLGDIAMIRVQPAGWSYEDSKGFAYPFSQKGRSSTPLAYLAEYFDAIELNNTFYRIPTPQMSRSWIKRTRFNPHFKLTAKLHGISPTRARLFPKPMKAISRMGLPLLWKPRPLAPCFCNFPTLFITANPTFNS